VKIYNCAKNLTVINEADLIDVNIELQKRVINISLMAGEAILEVYKRDINVRYKDDATPLTLADEHAHQIILKELRKINSDIPIVSEEDLVASNIVNAGNCYWLVDPLDGTKEFVSRNGEFTVNIALIQSNYPLLGVIFAPALGTLYYACRGLGAFKRDTHQDNPCSIYVNHKKTQFKIVDSRSHPNNLTNLFLSKIDVAERLAAGSSLKFCMVADGSADIYPRFGLTSHWDTAAAQCILEEAGGSVIDLNGERLCYKPTANKTNPFFIASGVFDHTDLISMAKSFGQH